MTKLNVLRISRQITALLNIYCCGREIISSQVDDKTHETAEKYKVILHLSCQIVVTDETRDLFIFSIGFSLSRHKR